MIEEIRTLLKKTVSEKRYIHCLGVAGATADILRHYNCSDYTHTWNGYEAASFCGTVHDLARELSGPQMIEYCENNSIEISEEERKSPLLLHGKASVSMIEKITGKIPDDWKTAICIHTTGDRKMNDLALALFIADFIEPSRTYMTDERRNGYLAENSLQKCAYSVLVDIMNHWAEKAEHSASSLSLAMKADLEKRIG